MTDKEIMDAMYECSQGDDAHCSKCAYVAYNFCHMRLYNDALALINRQQAEIERLETLAKIGTQRAKDYQTMRHKARTARAEAIKEFKCELIEQIEYIEDAHQAVYKDDFGKGWMAGFTNATHLITGAIDYIAGFENRGADNV